MAKIAIMGYGTIGSGVFHLTRENRDIILSALGEELTVKHVLDIRDFPGDPAESMLTKDVSVIAQDPEISIVVETMGGVEPAFSFVKMMLEAGKSVVTSNKALVAAKGAELMETANAHNVNFFFEASVGGAIPIIRPLIRCLASVNRIDEITGILNGTTNYIMTRMKEDGLSREDALAEAQEKGFAEKNPEADVEGYDACRKIAILSSIVSGHQVNYEEIPTEGIMSINTPDFAYAQKLGRAIRLLGIFRPEGEKNYAMVAPFLVDSTHPLYSVNGVYNAIAVKGNMTDQIMFYGQGAGSFPTAGAVMSDVYEAALYPDRVLYRGWSPEPLALADPSEWTHRYLIRMTGEDAGEALAAVTGPVEKVDAGIAGESGWLTGEISGKTAKEAEALPGFIHSLRLL